MIREASLVQIGIGIGLGVSLLNPRPHVIVWILAGACVCMGLLGLYLEAIAPGKYSGSRSVEVAPDPEQETEQLP